MTNHAYRPLSALNHHETVVHKSQPLTTTDPIQQFRAAMLQRGLEPPDDIEADGQLHRCKVQGDKYEQNGAYLLYLDGIPAGGIQNWKDDAGWVNWRADVGRPLTTLEEQAHIERVQAMRRAREAVQELERARAADESQHRWSEAAPAVSHPYLRRKGVSAHGVRVLGGQLLVPLYDETGMLCSLQSIDADGNKLFLKGGRKQGCYFTIGEIGEIICVVEGFATGASVRQATDHAVVVAFDSGNLCQVALALRRRHPKAQIIICADDDHATPTNPGVTKANDAASAVGALVALPAFANPRPDKATDFNDLHQAQGLGAVRKCIEDAHQVLTKKDEHLEQLERLQDQVRPLQRDGVILARGTDLEPQPVNWLWPGWLAHGKVHLIAGAPGEGKTTIALSAAATVTSGGQWPDGAPCEPGNVVIWSGEDDPSDTLMPRLLAMGADPGRIFFAQASLIGGNEHPFNPARELPQLAKAAKEHGNVKLIVIDPVVSVVTGDTHKNGEVRRGMQPLVDLATDLGAAVVGITHTPKGAVGRNPIDRVIGSIGFTAVVRVVLMTARIANGDNGEDRVLVRVKSNLGRDGDGFEYRIEEAVTQTGIPTSVVVWGDALEGSATELLPMAEVSSTEQRSAIAAAEEFLRQILTTPTPATLVQDEAKKLGHTKTTLRRAAKQLGVKPSKGQDSRNSAWYWSLPNCQGAQGAQGDQDAQRPE